MTTWVALVEEVRAAGRDLYVSYPDGQGRSKLDRRCWHRLPPATARSWKTVVALRDMAGG